MSPNQPPGGRSPIERLLGAAACLLLAALILQWAIQVIESIAVPLAIIASVVGAVVGLVSWLRYRGSGW